MRWFRLENHASGSSLLVALSGHYSGWLGACPLSWVKRACLIRARMSGNDMQRMMSWLLHLRHRHDLDDFYPCAGHSQKWMVFAE